MELFKASRQWSTRPADERFASLEVLDEACYSYFQQAAIAKAPWSSLQVEPDGEEVILRGSTGESSRLTHWSFGQVAQRAGAPAAYLRELPAELAAPCLRHGLARHADGTAALMFHRNGGLVLRSALSPSYTRIWNYEITGRLADLVQREPEWTVPPAMGSHPSGLYASDHDMFAFLVNESRRIEDGTDGGLARGFFVWNSEVGDAAFGIMTFLYRYVCGNHIVWGAKDVREVRIRHVGRADEKAFRQLTVDLKVYADRSASDDEAQIERAKTFELGENKDAVLDRSLGSAR